MARRETDEPARAAAATFNMTPMIDVVFQLIVVFLCSMKFRTLDQKIEAYLPKDEGIERSVVPLPPRSALRLRLLREAPGAPVRVVLHGEPLGTTAEGDGLWRRLEGGIAGVRARAPSLPAEIDASPDVDHGDVMRALDACVAAGLSEVTFRGTRPRP